MSDLTWEFNNCKHECVTYEEYVEMKKNYDNFVRSELKVTGKTVITILEYQKLMRFINDESKTQELCNIVNEVIERNEEDTTTYTREELDEMYYNYMTYVRNNEFIFLEQQKVKKIINDESKKEEICHMINEIFFRIAENNRIYNHEEINRINHRKRLSNDKCIEYVRNIINNIN